MHVSHQQCYQQANGKKLWCWAFRWCAPPVVMINVVDMTRRALTKERLIGPYFLEMRTLRMRATETCYFTVHSHASGGVEKTVPLAIGSPPRYSSGVTTYLNIRRPSTGMRGVVQLLDQHALQIRPLAISLCGVLSKWRYISHPLAPWKT